MFKNNKYHRWYVNIINKAKNNIQDGYMENHHILPRSCGGSDDPSNLVRLTYKQHFICHWLLTKCMINGEHTRNMYYALGFLCGNTVKTSNRGIIPAWKFELRKMAISIASSNRIVSETTKSKLRQRRIEQLNNPEFVEKWKANLCRDKWSEERKAKHRGNNYFVKYNKTEEHRKKVIKSNQKRIRTQESNDKISNVKSKQWKLTNINTYEEIIVDNLKKYCEEKGWNRGSIKYYVFHKQPYQNYLFTKLG